MAKRNSEDDFFGEDSKDEQIFREDNYKRTKSELKESVSELQGSINAMLDKIDLPLEQMTMKGDMLPGIVLKQKDFERDIEKIKIDARETLECLANLYLDEASMKNKNIYKIIKDDAMLLADLNFSTSCAREALVSCMTQIINFGVNDPLMFEAVSTFQKEMRDTIKATYDLQKKMKDFYKELKGEMSEINAGEKTQEKKENDKYTVIGDPMLLNDLLDKYKNDPSLLSELINKK